MPRINEASAGAVQEFAASIEGKLRDAGTLEEAAQALTDGIHEAFGQSIVLARVFATVPYAKAPPAIQRFVSELADSKGISDLITDETPVLCLLGTRGQEPAWNDRRNSAGHVGIPLASGDFVESIPMIARLLKELGVPLDWIDRQDADLVANTSGLFYVADAQTATDAQGRSIIAAQDFVGKYQVKSVFGIGGDYGSGRALFTLIVFTGENLTKTQTEPFIALVDVVKGATGDLVAQGKLFA